MSDDEKPPLTAEVLADAIGALAGYGAGGPEGAVAGAALTAPLARLAGDAWEELREFRANNVGRMLEVTSELTNTEPERMLRQALDDPAARFLLHEAMQAGAETLNQQKIDGLARALANGLNDRTKVDFEVLVIKALADLDPVHVQVLKNLGRGLGSTVRMNATDIQHLIDPYWFEDLVNIFEAVNFTPPVIATLERHGLIESRDEPREGIGESVAGGPTIPYVERMYAISEFGRSCLDHLIARREDSNE